MNTLKRSYRICNFTLTISPHWLLKLQVAYLWQRDCTMHALRQFAKLVELHF